MFLLADSFYVQWRLSAGAGNVLRDDGDLPPERLLQAVWQHQRLRRDRLSTTDGRSVRVIHPGFVSAEGGPDFRGAVLQLGDAAPRSGDVEVDLRPDGWRAHGHDRNPAFQNVLLHVVWEDAQPPAHAPPSGGRRAPSQPTPQLPANRPPRLPLSRSLDAPLGELSQWLEQYSPQLLPEDFLGKCAGPMRELDEARLAELLCEAGRVRFHAKAAQFLARARHAGWEQALWEGLFRALGYKHNVWPMHCLAESRRRWAPGADSVLALQTRLLGLSGLLPANLTGAPGGSDRYVRRLWDGWWRQREEFSDCLLPRAAWRFHGLRPANHPQRRLALAAHWLALPPARSLMTQLEQWCAADLADAALPASLRNILWVQRDEFWSWHWTFRSARLPRPQPLLGAARVTDLAVNVILPWLWVRAAEGKNEKLQSVIEHRYFVWPPAGDNAVWRLARQRLLGTGPSRALRRAAAQQGLTQIVRDFCDHTNAVCDECRFPGLVAGWADLGIHA